MFQNALKNMMMVAFACVLSAQAFGSCKTNFVMIQDKWCSDGSAKFYAIGDSGITTWNWTFTIGGQTAKFSTRTNGVDIAIENFAPVKLEPGQSYKVRIDTFCKGTGESASYTKYGTLGSSCVRRKMGQSALELDLNSAEQEALGDYLTHLNHASKGKAAYLAANTGNHVLVNDTDQVQSYVLVEKWSGAEMISGAIELAPGEHFELDAQNQEIFVFGAGELFAQDK